MQRRQRDVGRYADIHEPRHGARGREPAQARYAIEAALRLARSFPLRHVRHDGAARRDALADPSLGVDGTSEDDAVLIDHRDHRARGQRSLRVEHRLQLFELCRCRDDADDGAAASDGTCKYRENVAVASRDDRRLDREHVPAERGAKILAVGNGERVGPQRSIERPDVVSGNVPNGDVADVGGQIWPQAA